MFFADCLPLTAPFLFFSSATAVVPFKVTFFSLSLMDFNTFARTLCSSWCIPNSSKMQLRWGIVPTITLRARYSFSKISPMISHVSCSTIAVNSSAVSSVANIKVWKRHPGLFAEDRKLHHLQPHRRPNFSKRLELRGHHFLHKITASEILTCQSKGLVASHAVRVNF